MRPKVRSHHTVSQKLSSEQERWPKQKLQLHDNSKEKKKMQPVQYYQNKKKMLSGRHILELKTSINKTSLISSVWNVWEKHGQCK